MVSAEYMVFGRKGLGGPQLAEVERMLGDEAERVAGDGAWVQVRIERLERARRACDDAFLRLVAEP